MDTCKISEIIRYTVVLILCLLIALFPWELHMTRCVFVVRLFGAVLMFLMGAVAQEWISKNKE